MAFYDDMAVMALDLITQFGHARQPDIELRRTASFG